MIKNAGLVKPGASSPVPILKKKGLSDQDYRKVALQSYTECLKIWRDVNFPKLNFSFRRCEAHLTTLLQSVEVKKLPKAFKGLLCDFFSVEMKQERPSTIVEGQFLFYPSFRRILRQDLDGLTNRKRLSVLWDLMQCKALAFPAPESMVMDSYRDHASTLQKVNTTDRAILKDFRSFIQPWLSGLPAFLSSKTRLPNSHATFDTRRDCGGTFTDQLSRLTDQTLIQPEHPRLEPFTICLSGPAGSGKSLIQSRLGKRLSRFLEKDWDDCVYTRSSVIKHWDGYSNQPLVMIDDFGQKRCRDCDQSPEAMEFITMCSSVDYRLPMADLKEKGIKFNSPLLLLSTNHDRLEMNRYLSKLLMDRSAIDRRFDLYFRLSRDPRGKKVLISETLSFLEDPIPRHGIFTNEFHKNGQTSLTRECVAIGDKQIEDYLFHHFIEGWRRKSGFYLDPFSDNFRQPIADGWYLEYPKEPVHHNRAKAHAILEPLKVRMITVGPGDNWALKPLQKAMFNTLSLFNCFKPCFTPDYDEEVRKMRDVPGKWLSGDYSAATDGMHSQMMSVAIEELLSLLEVYYPELIPYVLMEASPHTIIYPSWTGIEPIEQTNGQLMGSLLSFPILSLVNAFTIGKATRKGIQDIPALIHGDDVLARLTSDEINRWKTVAPKVGFGLSIGKNYVSESWGSIDSQVFFDGERSVDCGKWKGLDSASDLNVIPLLIKRGFPKWLIVSRFKKILQKTHRSLEVSTEFGGLNPKPGLRPENSTDHAQYVSTLKRSVKIRKVLDRRFARISEEILDRLPFTPTRLPFELPCEGSRGQFSDFREVLKFRELGMSVPVGEFLPLRSAVVNIELQDHQVSFLKNIWRSLCPVLTAEDKEYFSALKRLGSCQLSDSQGAFDLL